MLERFDIADIMQIDTHVHNVFVDDLETDEGFEVAVHLRDGTAEVVGYWVGEESKPLGEAKEESRLAVCQFAAARLGASRVNSPGGQS